MGVVCFTAAKEIIPERYPPFAILASMQINTVNETLADLRVSDRWELTMTWRVTILLFGKMVRPINLVVFRFVAPEKPGNL